ncbi:MAG: hypothetical protein Ct9H90mP30_2520 [Actinomycetota bacterium]|nr:MAG: hypothetical protein Ct9H90mP30_2520 [Actinomycetota bacterium]
MRHRFTPQRRQYLPYPMRPVKGPQSICMLTGPTGGCGKSPDREGTRAAKPFGDILPVPPGIQPPAT